MAHPASATPDTVVDIVLDASGSAGFDSNGSDFDILREALALTGLDSVLADPMLDATVFAPTDAAFIALAQDLGLAVEDGDEFGALASLVGAFTALTGSVAGATAALSEVLLTHVAGGAQTLAELDAASQVVTLQGGSLTVDGQSIADAEPDLADQTVIAPDLVAGNGIVQVIDGVLLPIDVPGNTPNIVDIAAGSADFDLLVRALDTAGLTETVRSSDDITVFAPTDAAFTQLASDLGYEGDPADEDAVFGFLVSALTDLGGGDPIPLLTDILLYHVSPGAKSADEISGSATVETLLEDATIAPDGLSLGDAEPDVADPEIVIPDIAGSNGTIQAIDRVLLPVDIAGNAGETLPGTAGDDMVEGTLGGDLIFTFAGNDTIDAGAGDDHVGGGTGQDRISGGAGDDGIFGGAGRDLLDGGLGDDRLSGGSGGDIFDFRELAGDDRVLDIEAVDLAVFSTATFADQSALEAAVDFGTEGALITAAGGTVLLEGIDAAAFGALDFAFV